MVATLLNQHALWLWILSLSLLFLTHSRTVKFCKNCEFTVEYCEYTGIISLICHTSIVRFIKISRTAKGLFQRYCLDPIIAAGYDLKLKLFKTCFRNNLSWYIYWYKCILILTNMTCFGKRTKASMLSVILVEFVISNIWPISHNYDVIKSCIDDFLWCP